MSQGQKTIEVVEALKNYATQQIQTNALESNDQRQQIHAHSAALFRVLIVSENPEQIQNLFEPYSELVETYGNERERAVFEIYEKIVDYKKSGQDLNSETVMETLQTYQDNADWFVAFHGYLVSSLIKSYQIERAQSLELINKAVELIPNELDIYVQNARIQSTEFVAYFHNFQGNIELATENTARLLEFAKQSGQPLDSIDLINNLIYSTGVWRDHQTNIVLAEIVSELEANSESSVPGLTQAYIARISNELGEFERSLNAADQGLTVVTHDRVKNMLLRTKGVALAGLGRKTAAREALSLGGRVPVDLDQIQSETRADVLYAEALLAIAAKDNILAVKLLNRRTDVLVQRVLAANSKDTTSLLASLENTRERQLEREAAFKREAEKAKQMSWMLAFLAFIAVMAAISATLFARFRSRVAKDMETKAELLAIKSEQAASAELMKTEFLGMISHELRTPLNGIIGISDLLATTHPDPDIRKKTGIILDSGTILFNMVESIIDMSRIDGGKMELFKEPTDVSQLIENMAERYRQPALDKGLVYTVHIDEALAELVHIDAERVEQCVEHLLSNAVKFTKSGRVHIHATKDMDGDCATAKIIVADTGQGMSETVQARLFTPFLQADSSMTRLHNGSGLGLSISRALARMMGGDVTLTSRQDRGSVFTLTFRLDAVETIAEPPQETNWLAPDDTALTLTQQADTAQYDMPEGLNEVALESFEDRVLADPLPPIPISEQEGVIDLMLGNPKFGRPALHQQVHNSTPVLTADTQGLEGVRILIVEDLPSNRDIVKIMLEPEGCICVGAQDGEAALQILLTQSFDVILMDIRMPGMSGVETTRIIRNRESTMSRTPIIAITADSAADTNAAALAAGVDVFMTKPVLADELIETVRYVCRMGDAVTTTRRQTA